MTLKREHRTLNFKYPHDKNKLLDGRRIDYVAKTVGFNREYVSLTLCGKSPCTRSLAQKLVDRFRPGESVEDYFESNGEWE